MSFDSIPDRNIWYSTILYRVGAFIIDWFLAVILGMTIGSGITFMSLVILNMNKANTYDFVMVHNYPALIGTWVSILTFTFYSALMDSSKKQGTIGKLIFKIKAVGLDQQKVTFLSALTKYIIMWSIPVFIFGKYGIGAIVVMAVPILFTHKKQAIYDMISGNLVLNREPIETACINSYISKEKKSVSSRDIDD